MSDTYDFDAGFNGMMSEYRWRTAQRYLNGGSHALDVGAGTGVMSEFIREHFKFLVSIEPDEERHAKLFERSRGTANWHTTKQTWSDYRCANRWVDAVFMFGVLEHLESPISAILKAFFVLRPGGRLFITVPNAESLHRRHGLASGFIGAIDELSEQDYLVGHHRYYTSTTLVELLREIPFIRRVFEGIIIKPYPNSEMEKLDRRDINILYELGSVGDRYERAAKSRLCAELFVMCEKGRQDGGDNLLEAQEQEA